MHLQETKQIYKSNRERGRKKKTLLPGKRSGLGEPALSCSTMWTNFLPHHRQTGSAILPPAKKCSPIPALPPFHLPEIKHISDEAEIIKHPHLVLIKMKKNVFLYSVFFPILIYKLYSWHAYNHMLFLATTGV